MNQAKWQKAVEAFLAAGDFSANTKRSYSAVLAQFIEDVRPHKWGWEGRAIEWKATLAKSLTPASVAHHITCARSFVKWCMGMGYASRNPFLAVKVRVTGSREKQILTDQEVSRLLSLPQPPTKKDLRDNAMLVLMLYTGMRISGARMLDVDDLKDKGGKILAYYVGKGHIGKDAFAVLHPKVVKAIAAYLKATGRSRKSKGPLFLGGNGRLSESGMRDAINACFKSTGVQKDGLTVHSLRHTAATKAYRSGAKLEEVQRMLDHKSAQTTRIYLHDLDRADSPPELAIDYDDEADDAEEAEDADV